jgi:hypothetical protein
MRRLTLAAVACAVLSIALAGPAAAKGKDSSPFATGNRNAALLGKWWKSLLGIEVAKNPLAGNADPCIFLGKHVLAPAFLPGDPFSCTVGRNTSILAITFASECSDEEDDPFFGATPKQRRACAIAADNGIDVNQVGVDGPLQDVSAYRTQSPDQKVRLPDDDLFGVGARTMRFTADGWAPLIKPLPPGDHVITVHVAGEYEGSGGRFEDFITMNLTVLRR